MSVNSKYIDSYKQSHTHMLGICALILFLLMVVHDYIFFRLDKTYGASEQGVLFCNELHDITVLCVYRCVLFL